MKKLSLVITMMVMLLLASCGGSEESPASRQYDYNEAGMEPAAPAATEAAMEMDDYEYETAEYKDTNDSMVTGNFHSRKIIKTGYIYMETLEYEITIDEIKRMVNKYNGYTAYSQNANGSIYESGRYDRNSRFTIKVPSESFEAMYEELQSLGNVLNANEGKEDVTSQFVDIESRLTTLKVQEERLLSILENTDNLEDVIELEYALQNTRYEIERYTTNLRNLEDQVRFSTIDVNVQEVYEETVIPERVETFGDRIRVGLQETFGELSRGTQNFAVFVITQFPYLIFTAAIIYMGYRFFRRVAGKSHLSEATKKPADDHGEA